jgi:hypothetical protein
VAVAVLGAVAISGCGTATTSPSVARRPARHRRPTRHHRPAKHRRHRPTDPAPSRRSAPGLAVSHASSATVQPQPAAGSCHARGHGLFSLPDPSCTPGAISPAVTQADISSTICRSGYTETVRPSESITEPEKEVSLRSYGDSGRLRVYEYDHLVPLELGGAPNDPRNLWPEPGASPNPKDVLEDRLREMVCSGELPLAVARQEIARNWVAAYRRLIR